MYQGFSHLKMFFALLAIIVRVKERVKAHHIFTCHAGEELVTGEYRLRLTGHQLCCLALLLEVCHVKSLVLRAPLAPDKLLDQLLCPRLIAHNLTEKNS